MLLLKISSRRLKLFLSRPYTGLILNSPWVASLNNLHRSWHFTKHCRAVQLAQVRLSYKITYLRLAHEFLLALSLINN